MTITVDDVRCSLAGTGSDEPDAPSRRSWPGPEPAPPDGELGEWLVEGRRAIDGCEAAWLAGLATFDRVGGWAIDGHLSCFSWLAARTGLARSTAFERLRVAHELSRRPVLAAALAEGRASYAMVRLMVRATGTTPEVDESFVGVAEAGTVRDVEMAVRVYRLHADQERPLDERTPHRGLRIRDLGNGMARVDGILTDVEAAELEVALQVFRDEANSSVGSASTSASPADPVDESARADGRGGSGGAPTGAAAAAPVDESARADWAGPRADHPDGRPGWAEQQADALMGLVRAALGLAPAPAGDLYTVHVLVDHDRGCLLGRGPLSPDAWQRIACDCGVVTHHLDDKGSPLAVGRRHRTWSVAQRRAITVRDRGRCRWPGCENTRTDVHHLVPWSLGGPTDTSNGILLCPGHHTHIHQGFGATGEADGCLTFHRSNGSPIGATSAVRDRSTAWG